MSSERTSSSGGRGDVRPALPLALALVLVVAGCATDRKDVRQDKQDFALKAGESRRFDVDYRTGTLRADPQGSMVAVSFFRESSKDAVTVDCSRLGGGLIEARFRAFLNGQEVDKGDLRCLYMHSRSVVLKSAADTVKITDMVFVHVVE
jgi:hypothetical protein